MRIGTLVFAAVAAATLVGCATIKPMYVRGHYNPFYTVDQCTVQDCTVEVRVTADGNACTLSTVQILDVSQPPVARNITWKLVTEGYEFSKESYKFGIFIKNDPDEEFQNAQVNANGTLSLHFAHTASGRDYSYALTVRKKGGDKGFCATLDPWLIS
jgi:hypothetical protein